MNGGPVGTFNNYYQFTRTYQLTGKGWKIMKVKTESKLMAWWCGVVTECTIMKKYPLVRQQFMALGISDQKKTMKVPSGTMFLAGLLGGTMESQQNGSYAFQLGIRSLLFLEEVI
jgi:hypothetical protein